MLTVGLSPYRGLVVPDDIPVSDWEYSFRHVALLEWSLAHLNGRTRTAVQAGGSIGLWPTRLAAMFRRVITCEPDRLAYSALAQNVPDDVEIYPVALGHAAGRCRIYHRGAGSHRVLPGDEVDVRTIDSFGITDLDFLQLDVEGYEWHALMGARTTIQRCRPMLIQVEMRNHSTKYGKSDAEIRALMSRFRYREETKQGKDVVFGRIA